MLHREANEWPKESGVEDPQRKAEARIHGTNEVKCERLTVGIRGKAMSDTHRMAVYTHPNIDAGSKIYDYRELKDA